MSCGDGGGPSVCSTLLEAARLGLVEELRRLIQEGQLLDVGDTRGWRPLHEAAHRNHIECLGFILQQDNVDVDWRSFEGITALNVACTEGHLDIAERLLESGANPNLADHVETYPLFNAVKANSLDIVKLLVEYDAKIDAQLYCGTTALHQASSEGQEDIVLYLVQAGADLRAKEDYGITPLFSAAQYGHEACCRILLEKTSETGATDVVDMAADDGATALYLAAQEGHHVIVDILLENGASANRRTEQPVALPLHAALQFDHLECVELLLPHTELTSLDGCDVSPFYFSLTAGNTRCTEALVNGGIPASRRHPVTDGHRYSPRALHYFQGNIKYSRRLSPLVELAMNACSMKQGQVLLDARASPNSRTQFEAPPLLVALEHKRYELAQQLIRHGANVNVYHPKVICNMVLMVTYCNWYGLNMMLEYGAEAKSLFSCSALPRTPLTPVRQRLAELEDMMSEAEEEDYENEFGVLRYPIPFWRVLAENRMDGSRVTVAQMLHRVLQYVDFVWLDPRLRSYVDSDHEWRELCALTESPRELTHLCRVKIRNLLGPQRLIGKDPIKSLPLPEPVVEFLSYKELPPYPESLTPLR